MASAKTVVSQQRRGFQNVKRILPNILAVKALNFFDNTFRKQGFTDKAFDPWARRKNNTDSGRGILIKSGDTRLGIKKLAVSFKKILIGLRGPATQYAGFHNVGTGDLPQRQFIGSSEVLERQLDEIVVKEIDKHVFKNFT